MIINSQKLVGLFKPSDSDEVIIWSDDKEYAGFSVLRSYEENTGFFPAMTKSGKEDTKALIKIGVHILEKTEKKLSLFLSVSKFSKYRSSHFGIDFDDPDAPTKDSLNESEKSKQPIDIEERERFSLIIDSFSFIDEKTNKIISANDIIDYMYDLHIKTISSGKGYILKAKLSSRELVCNRIIPFFVIISKKSLKIFGKEIVDDKEDFTVGLFKSYNFTKHIITRYPYSLPFFSSDVRVSLINIFWIALSLLAFWFYDPAGKDISEVFSIALSIVFVAIFEFFIPFIIMCFVNSMIILRTKLETKRFKFS